MQFLISIIYLFTLTIASKTILLTNDDSWALTNIRATYRDLVDAGYDVLLVAPVSQRSGWAGKFDVPESKNLLNDGEFSYVKKGDPSWGHEDDDKNIWYFNGTPSSCVAFAIDYVLPNYFNNKSIDLTIGGPNEGPNLSPGFFTASGTMSAVYTSIYRGIPAISFSGSTLNNSFFQDSLNNNSKDAANIYSKKVVELTDIIFNNTDTLPNMLGLNVNFPLIGDSSSDDCYDPTWQLTRIMGKGVFTPNMQYNETTELMDWTYQYIDDIQKDCENGDCNLPSEYTVFWADNCTSTISVFSIDYDANLSQSNKAKKLMKKALT